MIFIWIRIINVPLYRLFFRSFILLSFRFIRFVSFRLFSFYILRLMNFKCCMVVNANLLLDAVSAVDAVCIVVITGEAKVKRALYKYNTYINNVGFVRVDSIFILCALHILRSCHSVRISKQFLNLFERSNGAVDIWLAEHVSNDKNSFAHLRRGAACWFKFEKKVPTHTLQEQRERPREMPIYDAMNASIRYIYLKIVYEHVI